MKNHNLSSTFTVIPKKSNKQSFEDKEKNKNNTNTNNLRESKNQNKMNYPIKHVKYNSVIGLNELKMNLDINKDNNIDNNLNQNNQSKDLITSMSTNNLEDLDEKLDIKFPYTNNININNSSISTQGQKIQNNLREKKIIKNQKKQKLNIMPIKSNEYRNNNINENLKENICNTSNKLNINNKNDFLLQNYNEKNKYIQNKKKENKNINIFSNMINKKKYRSIEKNNLDKDIFIEKDNSNYPNQNINTFKNHCNQNYNVTFENEYINKKNNNVYYQRPFGCYIKKIQNNNKEKLNFSGGVNNNKRFYSINKRDLKEFKKNHNYIQKIIDKIPDYNPKTNNINYEYRKNMKNNYYININLANKDNNEEYNNYNNMYNRDNIFIFNTFLKSDSNTKTINTNTNIFLKNNYTNNINNINKINNINTNNIKTVRAPRYLSVEKAKSILKKKENDNNMIYEKKIIEDKKINNNYHDSTFYNGFYNYKSKTKKSSSFKSAFISIKLKNFTEFIFNVCNRKFRNLLISFLDIKSLLILSSTNSDFFRNTRKSLYLYFYNNLINDKNKDKFINKILRSTKLYCTEKIKLKIKKGEFKSFYEKLTKKNELYDELILKDIPRTLPGDITFSAGKNNYYKLYRILTCFSNYNKKIGYAQGINFIIANAIYLFNTEEEVFIFFEGLINLLKMDNYIGLGNDKKMVNKLMEFDNILNKYIPDIVKFFDDKQVSHEFFTTKWIFTLFSTSIERNYLVIIWCFMIIFKWKFAYSYIIQILKKYKNNIFTYSDSQLCFKMKSILSNKEFKNDFNEILLNTINFMKNNIVI